MMALLIGISKAQRLIRDHMKARRLALGLTQAGLAKRADVKLPTLRNFEQKGLISLASFLRLLMVLNGLAAVVTAVEPSQGMFSSMAEVLKDASKKVRKRGWRK